MTEALQLLTYAIAAIAWLAFDVGNLVREGFEDDERGFVFGAPDDFNSFHIGS